MKGTKCGCHVALVKEGPPFLVPLDECPAHRARHEAGRSFWRVVRHGGRRTDRWRITYTGDANGARQHFGRARARLRQGTVLLLGAPDWIGDAPVFARDSGPTLRARW